MNSDIFAKYAQLKKQIVELEDQLDELKPEVTEELKKLPDSKLKTPFGLFSCQKRAKWTYSDVEQALEQQLKARQKEEQGDGTATAEYSEFVTFKATAAVLVG